MKILFVLVTLLAVSIYGKKGFGPTDQEWGYVTVRKDAHMFWWLHYTSANVKKYTDRPLLIWLQGGPGSSSTGYGNFHELGPLDESLKPRNTSWDKHANLLFVDNPVGTGFSYADSIDGYAKTNQQIADDFVELMKAFYQAVPDMLQVPLYIFSESYGGKMTVDIALTLDKAIKSGSLRCKLVGVGLGDSWISPIDSVMTWAPFLQSVGMVDHIGYNLINNDAKQVEIALQNGQYEKATSLWSDTEGTVYRAAGDIDFYNVLTKLEAFGIEKSGNLQEKLINLKDSIDVIMNYDVRKALNISQYWGTQSKTVFYMLNGDFMKPVVTGVEKLLNDTDIKVAVYNGQYDLIVDIGGTTKWMDSMRWKNKSECEAKKQEYYVVDGFIEGYAKKCNNLEFYAVLRAGHMVPSDNPAGMYYILKNVTNNFAV